LLPVGYFHLVFTLPGPIADIAHQNKAEIYGLLFTAAVEAALTIAATRSRRPVSAECRRRRDHRQRCTRRQCAY